MVCLYCRKSIGPFRRLHDRHFCCQDHRKKLTSRSARALREAEDLYGFEEQGTTWKAIVKTKPEDKTERKAGMGTLVFVGVAVVFLVLAMSSLPVASSGGGSRKSISLLPDAGARGARGGFGAMLSKMLQSSTSSTMHEDFRAGISGWEGFKAVGQDWTTDAGRVRPATLRLWKPSTSMSDYELEFMGQIERKGIDWAFRASDLRNYYATKLIITKPGPLPNAGLVRFIVLDGRERERVELPLPLNLQRGVDYKVRLSVRGSRFLTSVNGQLVSSWTDSRLSRGGVGFFSESGESSLVKWVSISERDSLVSRLVSHFSLITFPTAPGLELR